MPDQLASAVPLLHSWSCDERVAGARVFARSAAEWYSAGANDDAQSCISVLCAYLRVQRYSRGSTLEAESAVREEVAHLIMDFLRSGLGAPRGLGIVIDLSSARIEGRHVLDGVSFGPGLRLVLDRAHIAERSSLSFYGCRFWGCIVRLQDVYLHEDAELRMVGSTVEDGAWLSASTAGVHPTARFDVRGVPVR